MKKILSSRHASIAAFITVAMAAYFINVEVQSYLGRQALEKTSLTNLTLTEALAKANAENKLVLVDVSAIWCPTCRRLDNEVFSDAKVKQVIGESFVFSRLEHESEEGTAFLAKNEASGFPNLWLLDGKGKVVKRLKVTFNPKEFLAQLN